MIIIEKSTLWAYNNGGPPESYLHIWLRQCRDMSPSRSHWFKSSLCSFIQAVSNLERARFHPTDLCDTKKNPFALPVGSLQAGRPKYTSLNVIIQKIYEHTFRIHTHITHEHTHITHEHTHIRTKMAPNLKNTQYFFWSFVIMP